jgi:hypothetical protein
VTRRQARPDGTLAGGIAAALPGLAGRRDSSARQVATASCSGIGLPHLPAVSSLRIARNPAVPAIGMTIRRKTGACAAIHARRPRHPVPAS